MIKSLLKSDDSYGTGREAYRPKALLSTTLCKRPSNFIIFGRSTLELTLEKRIFRMIPVGNDVTRLVLLRDELYEATDVTFELNCDIRLCLMTEKDSICSEEIYDTSLCDKVTY